MAFPENAFDRLAGYGHNIQNQQVSGSATVHNGDNYVNASTLRQQGLALKF